MEKIDCYLCRFRRSLFNDPHSCCNNKAATVATSNGSPSYEDNGWYFWPFIYDPKTVTTCNGFVQKLEY